MYIYAIIISMKLKYWGFFVGLLMFGVLSFVAQTGSIHPVEGTLGYFQNAAFLFNFTSLLIPAIISSILFPNGGIPDVIIILFFSFFQFTLGGFTLGWMFEKKGKK